MRQLFTDFSRSTKVLYSTHIGDIVTEKSEDCCAKDWRTNLAAEALVSVCR